MTANSSSHSSVDAPESADFDAQAQRCLAYLRRRFPAAFGSVKPLARGIRDELMAECHMTELTAIRGMSFYTQSPAYLRACIQPGAMRHDLQGRAIEPVSSADRAYAAERLAQLLTERQDHQRWLAFRAALLEPVPMPETDDLPTGGTSKC